MAGSPDTHLLSTAIDKLREAGVVPGVATGLEAGSAEIVHRLRETIFEQVPAYTESGNPDVLPELQQHLEDQVDEVCRLLGGGPPGDFGFVARHAERRAEQKFPLDALLQAYRCLHKLLSVWVREAALETADETAHVRRVVAAVIDFTIEYTGAIGSLATSRYVQHTRLLAEAEGDRRTKLLNTLLNGYDEADARAARLLRRAGYLQQRQSYCVAVARSVNPAEMENVARAQRMVDAISKALDSTPLRTIVGIRDNHVVAIVSGTRRLSGWTRPQSLLADRVYPQLRTVGPAALIGLSNDVPSTSHIPRAAMEARLALDFASVAQRVLPYAHIPFRQMLVSHARDTIQSALPAWLDDFLKSDAKSKGALAATLDAYADADMNVLQAAKALAIHPNTVYARMQKIERITGRNPLSYHALTELLLAVDCAPARQ
jgi:hypothetical protein